jgi:hypothetical protein
MYPGAWKSQIMMDRYANLATWHLQVAAFRIKEGSGENVVALSRFHHVQK